MYALTYVAHDAASDDYLQDYSHRRDYAPTNTGVIFKNYFRQTGAEETVQKIKKRNKCGAVETLSHRLFNAPLLLEMNTCVYLKMLVLTFRTEEANGVAKRLQETLQVQLPFFKLFGRTEIWIPDNALISHNIMTPHIQFFPF